MATFNVFVEGPVDPSPAGPQRLADAMAQRYGLPASELIARFQRGRFRVKSNVDAATAETYRRDLEKLGARVLIEDSALSPTATPPVGVPRTATPPVGVPAGATVMGAGLARKTPAPGVPAPRPPTPPAGATVMGPGLAHKAPAAAPATTPPANVANPGATVMGAGVTFRSPADSSRPATPAPAASSSASGLPRAPTPAPVRPSASALPPATAPTTNAAQPYASGLAAAYSQELPVTSDLGALGDGAALSLASLDGEDSGPPPGAFDLPPQAEPPMPASFGPPAAKVEPPKPAAPSAPVDLFAPPESLEAQAASFELSDDEVDARAKQRASAPPEDTTATPVRPSSPVLARRTPASMAAVEPAPATGPRVLPRTHVIAGVVLAVLIAFIPVHFVAAAREQRAYAAIDRAVIATQQQASTYDAYDALDGYRATQLDAKESAQRSIALTSMLLWAALAAGLAYVYFRRVPWDRVLKPSA